MWNCIKRAILLLLIFTAILGILYPLSITAIAQLFFYEKANGSIIEQEGEKIGSLYIGQEFKEKKYFWSRPSASQYQYATGSNKAILQEKYQEWIAKREEYLKGTSYNTKEVPKDLITESASGVDPNITLEAAYYQIDRIAEVRSIEKQKIIDLINANVVDFPLVGNTVVNVLTLNIELDKLEKQ